MKTRRITTLSPDPDGRDCDRAYHLKNSSGRYFIGREDEVHRGEDGVLYRRGRDGVLTPIAP